LKGRVLGFVIGLGLGLQLASQTYAWTYGNAEVLGPRLRIMGETRLYPPWSLMIWHRQFAGEADETARQGALLVLLSSVLGLAVGARADANRPLPRVRGWGQMETVRAAGLLSGSGAVVGVFKGRVLMAPDLRPTLVTGGTRSGKGRGHVTPTLLAWTGSVLVHDPKRELWSTTSGWRSSFSHALYFDPRDPGSARWNPLAEIQPGPGELAQVQRLTAILSDTGGARDDDSIWDRAASEILEAVILHVLYVEPDASKTLVRVRELLADLDATAQVMATTLHRESACKLPETHPFIRTAVIGYGAMHDRFRTSVQGTARSYLKWLAGDDLERVVSASDFAIGDLMCAEVPVSLYVQVAPADAAALRPLVRLLIYAAAQSLTAEARKDSAGRAKIHDLLMVMDEFPLLGRLAFFEKSLRLMSGYGIKVMFVAQSLNDIVETYGPHNTILDNCGVYTAFSALDPLTQDKISRLTGTVSEPRTSYSGPAGLGGGQHSVSKSEIERPLLEPGEVRSLPEDRQIVFAAGHRPLLTHKLLYDRCEPFKSRADLKAPDQVRRIDAPPGRPHNWFGHRGFGQDPDSCPGLFGTQGLPGKPAGTGAPLSKYIEIATALTERPYPYDPLNLPPEEQE